MNGGKSCKGESRNKRKCENTTKPLHSLFWIIPLRELDFQLSFFALLLTILFLRNTNVILSCFFFNVYILRKKQELEDEETTDETRAEEREGEESDNDSSSGSDCDFENE